MGLSIYQRRARALSEIRKKLPDDVDTYSVMKIVAMAIDIYICGGNVKRCKGTAPNQVCDKMISPRNRTGLCKSCYQAIYRKKDQPKRLDALRQKYYRKNRKLRILKQS